MLKIIYNLKNLTCEACIKLSEMKIGKIPGVNEVRVRLDGKTEIMADRKISKDEVQEALKGTNYEVV